MFRLKLLDPSFKAPKKVYEHDAGFDVYNNTGEKIVISVGMRAKIPLGFCIELQPGYVAIMHEKSGMANKQGIVSIGNVIDSTYRGECHVILLNTSFILATILPGQKIAQMLIIPCYTGTKYELVETLSPSDRGQGGFGSTGL